MSQNPNTSIAVVGIDIGKNSFHVVGLDQRGALIGAPARPMASRRFPPSVKFARVIRRLRDPRVIRRLRDRGGQRWSVGKWTVGLQQFLLQM